MTGASQATGLGSAKAPEPHSGLRPAGAIPRAAFTPGPWSVSTVTYGSGKRHNILNRTGKSAVAHTYGDPRPAAENEANARLIAAAPELYVQLEISAAIFRGYQDIHKAKCTAEGASKAARNAEYAREAERILAKARGEQP